MVRHKNVVSLKEIIASKTKVFFVYELVPGGELFDKIINEGRFSEEKARFYIKQLIEGVSYCYGVGISHEGLVSHKMS